MTDLPQTPVSQLVGSNGSVHALAYSASPGTYILTGSSDRSIRLYNPSPSPSSSSSQHIPPSPSSSSPNTPSPVPQGRLIQTYTSHGYEILSLTVAQDNARFASAGGDRTLYLWDVATALTTRRFGGLSGHSSRINTVVFAGTDDSLLISGGLDTTVRIWDCKSSSAKPVQVLDDAKDSISAVVVSGEEIIAGSVDGRVRSYDVRMGRVVSDTMGGSVTSLCLGRDGRTVLVGTLDSTVRLMDRRDGVCLRAYKDKGWRNEELRVQSVLGGRERWVLAGDEMTAPGTDGGNEGTVWAWDLMTGKLVAKIKVPWGPGVNGGKRVVGRDGQEKERKNVVSCIAWKEGGFGNQFCVGGTSGVVTVYGEV